MLMVSPLWQPSQEQIEGSNIAQFMKFLRDNNGETIIDFEALYTYSLQSPEAFWFAIWKFCGVKGDPGEPPYLSHPDKMPGATFFPNATLNFAENLLVKEEEETAIHFRGEDKVRRKLSWNALNGQVSQLQQFFVARGITSGDRVAAMMPNMPETISALLATASLGAVWSSCSPDFGIKGVLDRFGQIEPKILIACDGYYYNGKTIRIDDKLAEIVHALPSLKAVIVIPYLGKHGEVAASIEKATTLEDVGGEFAPKALHFEQLAFSHPLYILFSSGTTGVPKCIVHSAGGTLLQHLKEHKFHCDLKPDDKLFYFTTCGWMMWNWLVSGLATGATLLLFDGSPFAPSGEVLFDYAQEEGMTIFGTSAKYIDAIKKAELRPGETHNLSALRLMASTGSPLAPESYDFVYAHIKSDLQLASISGGTDIVSCFVLGNPVKPVWKGEIQGPGLGMAVEIFDEVGKPQKSGKGELVCTKPFPAMPIGFWNDPDGHKYHNAYFGRFENVWHHGDFAEWTEHGGIII
ncbi:MAG: acetoacetate--CoA ligase, partial [Methyloligellaceae bacterium]